MREASLRRADLGLIAFLAAAAGVLAIVGALFLASMYDNDRDPNLEPLKAFARMRHLAGPGAIACGQVAEGTHPGAAMACARKAAQTGRAFWVAKEHVPGHRGLHMTPVGGDGHRWWHGLVRTTRGRFYLVTYDHDGSGGWAKERHPAIWTLRCREPKLEAEGWHCAR